MATSNFSEEKSLESTDVFNEKHQHSEIKGLLSQDQCNNKNSNICQAAPLSELNEEFVTNKHDYVLNQELDSETFKDILEESTSIGFDFNNHVSVVKVDRKEHHSDIFADKTNTVDITPTAQQDMFITPQYASPCPSLYSFSKRQNETSVDHSTIGSASLLYDGESCNSSVQEEHSADYSFQPMGKVETANLGALHCKPKPKLNEESLQESFSSRIIHEVATDAMIRDGMFDFHIQRKRNLDLPKKSSKKTYSCKCAVNRITFNSRARVKLLEAFLSFPNKHSLHGDPLTLIIYNSVVSCHASGKKILLSEIVGISKDPLEQAENQTFVEGERRCYVMNIRSSQIQKVSWLASMDDTSMLQPIDFEISVTGDLDQRQGIKPKNGSVKDTRIKSKWFEKLRIWAESEEPATSADLPLASDHSNTNSSIESLQKDISIQLPILSSSPSSSATASSTYSFSVSSIDQQSIDSNSCIQINFVLMTTIERFRENFCHSFALKKFDFDSCRLLSSF